MFKFLLATVCTLPLAFSTLVHAQTPAAPATSSVQDSTVPSSVSNDQVNKQGSSAKETDSKVKTPCNDKAEEPKTEAASEKLSPQQGQSDSTTTPKVINPIISANDKSDKTAENNQATSDEVAKSNLEKKN